MEEIRFSVNGLPQHIISDPNKSLLKVLKEDLRLTGHEGGCSAGHGGTCAVTRGRAGRLRVQAP